MATCHRFDIISVSCRMVMNHITAGHAVLVRAIVIGFIATVNASASCMT